MREQAYSSYMQPRIPANNERALVANPLDIKERARPVLGAEPYAPRSATV